MPVVSITKRLVDSLKPGAKEQLFWDETMPGFAVRIMPSGYISFIVQYRAGKGRAAPTRKVSLGQYGKVTPEQARELARKELAAATMGGDPVAARKAKLAAVKANREKAWEVVLETFAARHLSSIKTGAEVERAIRRHTLPRWAGKRIDKISKSEVIALLDDVGDSNTLHSARLLRAYLSKLFTWAEGRDIVPFNPVRGTIKPIQVIERDRVLSETELKAFWQASETEPYPWQPFLHMLALTAQRRDEVAAMQWADIDMASGVWTIAREGTKADRAQEVPLSNTALKLLSDMQPMGAYVFTTDGQTFIQSFSPLKKRLDAMMAATLTVDVKPWRYHDLRRTAATFMGRHGVQRDAITLVLNHSLPGITAIYDRAARLPEKRHALEVWAKALGNIVGPLADSNIVPLKGRHGA